MHNLLALKKINAARDPNAPITLKIIGVSFSIISIQKSGIAFLNRDTALFEFLKRFIISYVPVELLSPSF